MSQERTLLQLYPAAFRPQDGPTRLKGYKALSKCGWSVSSVPCKGRFGPRRAVGSC